MKLYEIKGVWGGLKITREYWDEGQYIYLTKYGAWLDNEGEIYTFGQYCFSNDDWEPYVEPKKTIKVTLYRYLYNIKDGTVFLSIWNTHNWETYKDSFHSNEIKQLLKTETKEVTYDI